MVGDLADGVDVRSSPDIQAEIVLSNLLENFLHIEYLEFTIQGEYFDSMCKANGTSTV